MSGSEIRTVSRARGTPPSNKCGRASSSWPGPLSALRQNGGKREGFTLIELLVVLAITGVLAALLLAGISRANQRAQSVVCRSTLRQLGLTYRMYIDDFPLRRTPMGSFAVPQASVWPRLRYDPYGLGAQALLCPTAPIRTNLLTDGWGTVFSAWHAWHDGRDARLGPYDGSYAWNAWLVPNSGPKAYEDTKIPSPATVPVFCDSVEEVVSPLTDDRPPNDLFLGALRWDTGWAHSGSFYGMQLVTIPRHGSRPLSIPRDHPLNAPLPGAINMVFYDTHVETVPLEHLWRLDWHVGWVPRWKHPVY